MFIAARTFLSDHKVDPLYIEFWMGHAISEQQKAYIIKKQRKLETNIQNASRTMANTPQQAENGIISQQLTENNEDVVRLSCIKRWKL